jgi:hypothetical protein
MANAPTLRFWSTVQFKTGLTVMVRYATANAPYILHIETLRKSYDIKSCNRLVDVSVLNVFLSSDECYLSLHKFST